MNYVALVITTVLALLGWFKPSTPPSWMTYIVVVLLLLLSLFQGVMVYRKGRENKRLEDKVNDLHQESQKKPIFDILLNGKQIKERCDYPVAMVEGELPLEFTLKNNGNLSAEELQVHLLLPRVFEYCNLGRHWVSQGSLQSMKDGKPLTTDIIEDFAFIGPAPIHPGNWMRLGNGKVKLLSGANKTIAAKIKVHCKSGAYTERHFFIHAE
ncbi:hypothetical protein AB8E32_07030 [Marinomonas polaris]|uniref:hypothetical protein n=1 Tax=Marinomonas polaris TaxID=293552 RepID=UPI003511DF54